MSNDFQTKHFHFNGGEDIEVCVNGKFKDLSTEEAIKKSREKWIFIEQTIVDNPEKRILSGGMNTCALCAKFYNRMDRCNKCPIMKFTGFSYCKNTDVWLYEIQVEDNTGYDQEEARKISMHEVGFLDKLLKWYQDGNYKEE